jgi:hypothetical protein
MKVRRGWAVTMLLTWTLGTGCTSLREIPSADYVGRVQERPVRVLTTDGLKYELDTASVEGDTLVGYRRMDVGGPVDQFATVRVPLDRVASISARRIDWYRTGLVGGISLAAVVAAGMARHKSSSASPTSNCTDPLDPLCK